MKAPTSMSVSSTTTAYPIFIYGTLMAPQVLQTLLGRSLSTAEQAAIQPARLASSITTASTDASVPTRYARHPVRGQVFPAVIETTAATTTSIPPTSSTVQGLLLPALSTGEMALLDWFESEEYTRKIVQVFLVNEDDDDDNDEDEKLSPSSSSSLVDAEAYIWRSDLVSQLDLSQVWSFEHFRDNHLEWYLEGTVIPCREEMVRFGMTKA